MNRLMHLAILSLSAVLTACGTISNLQPAAKAEPGTHRH
jgi:hypothetical protein